MGISRILSSESVRQTSNWGLSVFVTVLIQGASFADELPLHVAGDDRMLRISPRPFAAKLAQESEVIEVLAWPEYADEFEEYPNTLEAISQFFTDYNLSETRTQEASVLAAELEGKSVLLFPEPEENGFAFGQLGTTFGAVLREFVEAGGTVILTGLSGSAFGVNSGLIDITNTGNTSTGSSVVTDASHELAEGLPSSFPIVMRPSSTLWTRMRRWWWNRPVVRR